MTSRHQTDADQRLVTIISHQGGEQFTATTSDGRLWSLELNGTSDRTTKLLNSAARLGCQVTKVVPSATLSPIG